MKNISTPKTMLFILALSALFALPMQVVSSQNMASNTKSYSINKTNSNGKKTIRIKDDKNDFKIEYEGEITISDDDRDITAIENGGFIEITKSSFGNRRRILIESDRNGTLIRKFYVGGSKRDYAPDGKAWLAQVLPEVVRSTGLGAASRVDRFYKKGGADAVLDEIGRMESDYVKTIYFELLLTYDLNTNELIETIETAGRSIDSDHYLSEILKSNQKAFLANERTVSAYIEASSNIESDHYLTNVLKEVINDSSISDAQLDQLLEISKQVESDHYISEILMEVMDERTLNAANISKIISLSKDIESDHYKSEVLKKVIRDKDIPADAYAMIMETITDIESDHYISEVIIELMNSRHQISSGGLTNLIAVVNTTVDSDHYAAEVYKKIAKEDLSEEDLIQVLEAVRSIDSDHYLGDILVAYSSKVSRSTERVKSAYRATAKTMSSDSHYGRAVKAID